MSGALDEDSSVSDGAFDRPEELGQNVDGVHGVLVLLIEHEMTETPAVLWPRVLSRGFGGTHEEEMKDTM